MCSWILCSWILGTKVIEARPGVDERAVESGATEARLRDEDAAAPDESPTYHGAIRQLLEDACGGCHTGERPKGRFRVDDPGALLAGGRSGPAIVASDPGASRILALVRRGEEPEMPPDEVDRLSESEIALLETWIRAGAPLGVAIAAVPYSRPRSPPVYSRAPALTALAVHPSRGELYVGAYREVLVLDVGSVASGRDADTATETGASAGGEPVPRDPLSRREPRPLARLVGESERIHGLAIDRTGTRLAVAGGSPGRFGEIQIWDLAERALVRFRRDAPDSHFAVAYEPDGDRLVVGGADRRVACLDGRTLEPVWTAEVHADWILSLAWSPGAGPVVSGSRDQTVKALEAASGAFIDTIGSFPAPVAALAVRPDGKELLIGAGRSFFHTLSPFAEKRKDPPSGSGPAALAFRPDSRLYAVAPDGGGIRLSRSTNGETWAQLDVLEDSIYALAFTLDGGTLFAAGHSGLIHVIDVPKKLRSASFCPVPLAVKL
jgi:mono/diheme cytochrome c family protein